MSHESFSATLGSVQERCNSSTLAMELRLSCTNTSICALDTWDKMTCFYKLHVVEEALGLFHYIIGNGQHELEYQLTITANDLPPGSRPSTSF